MKKKRLITNLVVIGLVVVAFIGIFLSLWLSGYDTGDKNVGNTQFQIFANKEGMEYEVLGLVSEIALLVALVLGALYVVCYLLAFFGIGKNWNKILKVIAGLEILVAIVGIVTGVLFAVLTTSNVHNAGSDIPIFGGIIAGATEGYFFTPDIGFYMLSLGTLFSGIVGVFANRK